MMKRISLKVSAGVDSGSWLRVRGQGNDGEASGDLFVVIIKEWYQYSLHLYRCDSRDDNESTRRDTTVAGDGKKGSASGDT